MNEYPRILVADGDEITRQVLMNLLERESFDTVLASSGKDALLILENEGEPIDVVLLDIMMPDLDGFEVLKMIKANPKTAKVKVIMLSARTQVEDKVQAFSSGVADYLVKPFEYEELVARINNQIKITRAEEKLRENELKFRSLYDLFPQAIFEIDFNGTLTYCNKRLLEITGYTREDLDHGTHVQDMFIPEDRDKIAKDMSRVMGEKSSEEHEYTIIGKNGCALPVLVDASSILQECQPVGVRGIAFDISTYKLMEEELRAFGSKYSSVVERANDTMLIVRDNVFIFVNSKATELLKYPREELIGMEFMNILAPNSVEIVKEAYRKRQAGEAAPNFYEIEVLDKECTTTPVEINAGMIEYDGAPANLIIVRDISERRRAEELIREAQSRYVAIFDSPLQMAFVIDPRGNVLEANSCARDWIGYGHGEKVEKSFVGFAHPEDLPACMDSLANTLDGKKVPPLVSRVVIDDGDVRWIESVMIPLYHGDEAYAIMGLAQDITGRKQTEDNLQREKAFAQSVLHSQQDLVFVMDRGGTIMQVSGVTESLMGYEPGELIGRSAIQLFTRDYLHNMLPMGSCESIDGTLPVVMEMSLQTKTGERFPASFTGAPIKDAQGNVISAVCVGRDLREQKRAESEIIRTRDRLNAIINSATGFYIATADLAGNITSWNKGAEIITGYCEEEVVGTMNIAQMFSENDIAVGTVETGMKEIIEKGSYEREVEFVRKGGEVFPAYMSSTLLRDEMGSVMGILAIIQDITEKKRAEKEIKRHIELSQDIIITTDIRSKVLSINPAFTRILGWEAHEIISSTYLALTHPEENMINMNAVDAIAAGGSFRNFESRLQHKDGSWIWFNWSVTVISEDGGKIYAIGRDITEHKRAEEEKAKMQQEMVDVSRQAGMAEVATSILHNVGNVLNSVNVSALLIDDKVRHSNVAGLSKAITLMQKHEDDLACFLTEDTNGRQLPRYLQELSWLMTEEQTSVLREIDELARNINYIKEIVILQQSHARVYGIEETFSPVDILEDAIAINARAMGQLNIELVREYAEVAPLTNEKHKVLQVLTNLLTNARHALRDSDNTDNILTLRVIPKEGDFIVMEIEDNGVGISEENLDKIFAHGFTTKEDGHGFGLHSSALAAQQMGGALTVCSKGKGKGCTFKLELPCKLTRENWETVVRK